jgi:hypothetical protein
LGGTLPVLLAARVAPLLLTLLVVTAGLLGSACNRQPEDLTPERVVESFLERMRSVHGDRERGRRAFELLWRSGRQNLEERARRATAASGRAVAPEEMLVPSRFSLRFEPRRMSSETRGDWSRVTLLGDLPSEVAEVHCVREEGQWRVVVDLPSLSAIEKRD